jgi:hypothetical protein
MPEGWWLSSVKVVTDVYNALYDKNPRWKAEAAGIADPVGADEEAFGATIAEALTNLAEKLRAYKPLYPPFSPGVADAMDALWGQNQSDLSEAEAVAILNERSPQWDDGGWPTHVQEVNLTPEGQRLGERREVPK